jgi:hypothetical protein
MPGLMDMHTHLTSEDQLVLYLANGITTVRHMSGDSLSLRLRTGTRDGTLLGPRIITAGPLIDGAPRIWAFGHEITDPAAVDSIVRQQKIAGYDFVKVYSRLAPTVFDAIIAAAKKYDIEVSGHVPQDVPLLHAIESGLRTSEHFLGTVAAVMRDSSMPSPDLAPYDDRAKAILIRLARGQLDPATLIDSTRVARLVALLQGKDFWFDPTHDIMRNFTSRPVTGRPEALRYVPASARAMLAGVHQFFKLTPEMLAGEDSLYQVRTTLLGMLHRGGARIIAGTDNAFLNGWALKDEIVALARAGLGNAGALRAATINAAGYLGKAGELGEVKEGAIADLVLLPGNPFSDLEALYRTEGVMARGVWRTAADFAPLLDAIAARAATP